MSDFTSNFWSVYVTVITVVSIAACLLLLWFSGKAKAMTANDNTTGHVWDGDLREMNNPLPSWWVWLFVITIVFAGVYLAMYPGLGNSPGKLGWSSSGQHKAEMEKGEKDVAPLYAKFLTMKAEDMARDPQAMGIGERLFMNNCAQCHGSDARGSKGFPNLTDGDWLHGGTPEKIKETITKGRIGNMPPIAAAVGTSDDVKNVAHYVLSLSKSPHDSLRASLGQAKFGVCAACHGMDGKGNPALGAPNLTDDIWLHGWGEGAILNMVNNGKVNQMPAQEGKLSEAQIHVLTSYVWGLSNGSKIAGK
jgi:cytochrome c oxidase cbb3-type subunit 3